METGLVTSSQPDHVVKESFISRLESIDDLPSLPEIVTRLTRAIADPNTSANDVAGIMQDDPAVTAKILRLVNSSFYGPVFSKKEITSIPYAIARMGFNEVRNVVLTMSVFSMFNKYEKTIDRREFWRHCISVAITTKVIHGYAGKETGIREMSPETFFVAGLLHDMGIIVLEQYFHKSFAHLCQTSESLGVPMHKAEEQIWDVGHADIGAFLVKKWNMPMAVVEAVNFHHQPHYADDAYKKIVAVVHLADFICNSQSIGDSAEGMFDGFAPESLLELGIPMKKVSEIIDVVIDESSKSEILLSLAG